MRAKGTNSVGRFAIEFEVANNLDVAQVKAGVLKPDKVRRTMLQGVVDCGASHLILPKSVADELGLPKKKGKVRVKYADQRTALRDAVEQVSVTILKRAGTFDATVEPKRKTALIGAIVLEAFDLLPDCTNQRLIPRDPRFITSEIGSDY